MANQRPSRAILLWVPNFWILIPFDKAIDTETYGVLHALMIIFEKREEPGSQDILAHLTPWALGKRKKVSRRKARWSVCSGESPFLIQENRSCEQWKKAMHNWVTFKWIMIPATELCLYHCLLGPCPEEWECCSSVEKRGGKASRQPVPK